MVEWSLITGWLPAALTATGMLILLGLIVLPPRRKWWRAALWLMLATGVFVIAMTLFVTRVWKPFPDALPFNVLLWSWLGLSGVVLAVTLIVTKPRDWWVVMSAIAGVVVLVGIAGVQVNRNYGQYPTLGVALGLTRPKLTDLSTVETAEEVFAAPADSYLAETWQPTQSLPSKGIIAQVDIEGAVSGFKARPAHVYLPPAYFATEPRPLLPVLVLLAGQPGNTDSWLVSGQLAQKLDRYAAAHNGLAPIVVMPDPLGSNFADPLCVDSPKGNVETYLRQDVPAWIRQHLQIAQERDMWVIGGLSNGGTCAMQMAVRAPETYGRFLDIAGEYQPLDGSEKETVSKYFGGDPNAYAAINPVEIMKTHRFDDTAGRLVAGTGDDDSYQQLKQVLAATEAAGMDMTWLELAGGHNWQVWAPGLEQSLPWLAAKTRLVRG
jgi:S-formylglutathione hydrolase FrmB